MKSLFRHLIPMLLICCLLLGGCTSPGTAKKEVQMDMKSVSYLMQLAGLSTVLQYRMSESLNEAQLMRYQTVLGDSGFSAKVQLAYDFTQTTEQLLTYVQDTLLPIAIVYITGLPKLKITQQHIDGMIAGYKDANLSLSTCFDYAIRHKTGIDNSKLDPVIADAEKVIADAEKIRKNLQDTVSKFISTYTDDPEDLGYKMAFNSKKDVIEPLQAANRILTSCASLMEWNMQLAKGYRLCSQAVYQVNSETGFPAPVVSQLEELVQPIPQALTAWQESIKQVSEDTAFLELDAAPYMNLVSHMHTVVTHLNSIPGAMKAYNQGQEGHNVNGFVQLYESSYENMTPSRDAVTNLMHQAGEKATAMFKEVYEEE